MSDEFELGPCPVCGLIRWTRGHHHGNEFNCDECGAQLYWPCVMSKSDPHILKHPERKHVKLPRLMPI